MNWNFNDDMNGPGWYAILYSWDSQEGTFPGAARHDGVDWIWDSTAMIVGYAGPFVADLVAMQWAKDNDPGY